MRLLARVAAGLVLLLVLVIGAALVALPRLLEGDGVRKRIEQAARDTLGRELRYASLDFGLLPPSLRVVDTTLSGETRDDPPLLEAREIQLRVALLPLLFRTVLVDTLVVEGATLRLTRGADGLELPQPRADAGNAGEGAEAASGAEAEAESGSGMDLAVRDVRLRETTLHLVDRAVAPAVTWELREIDARATGSLDAPIELALEASLARGGQVEVEGTASLAGELDLAARLDDVVVDALAPYLEGIELAGRVGGTARVVGPAAALETLTADLRGADLRFRRGDVSARGAVSVRADVTHPTGTADGRFELDATDAELVVGGGFTKPKGTQARVTGRIAAAEAGGLAFEDVKLVIKNFEASGRVGSLAPLRLELEAKPFELAGWEALLPALASSQPKGQLRLAGLRYRAEPPDLRGEIGLEQVRIALADSEPITLRGLLRAEGAELASEGLVAETAGQTLNLDARLTSLFDTPRYRVDVKTDAADSNALLTTLLAKPDTLFGPLALDGSFRGTTGGDVLAGLDGRVDFGIENGRLAGVSLLRAVFDRLGAVGGLALNLGKAFGGRDLQRFYDDEFQVLSGVLDISDGVARTDDLTFLYRGYGVKLRGTLGLADLALDMKGDLTLLPEIDAELAQELKLPSDYTPQERVIPLASVTGRLGEPRVRLAPGTAVALGRSYAGDAYAGDLRKKVEDELGEGTGVLVDQGLDILQGILGGRGAPRPDPGPKDGGQPPQANP